MEEEITTIKLKKSAVQELKNVRPYPRETYNDIILRLITQSKETEELGIFDQNAQETKMNEFWSEGDYSGLENA